MLANFKSNYHKITMANEQFRSRYVEVVNVAVPTEIDEPVDEHRRTFLALNGDVGAICTMASTDQVSYSDGMALSAVMADSRKLEKHIEGALCKLYRLAYDFRLNIITDCLLLRTEEVYEHARNHDGDVDSDSDISDETRNKWRKNIRILKTCGNILYKSDTTLSLERIGRYMAIYSCIMSTQTFGSDDDSSYGSNQSDERSTDSDSDAPTNTNEIIPRAVSNDTEDDSINDTQIVGVDGLISEDQFIDKLSLIVMSTNELHLSKVEKEKLLADDSILSRLIAVVGNISNPYFGGHFNCDGTGIIDRVYLNNRQVVQFRRSLGCLFIELCQVMFKYFHVTDKENYYRIPHRR